MGQLSLGVVDLSTNLLNLFHRYRICFSFMIRRHRVCTHQHISIMYGVLLMQVLSWPVNQQISRDDHPAETNILEGPVLFVRFSLDGTILAIQRSGQEVEFVSKGGEVLFRQRCRHVTDQILGLFWSDCPTCDVVFVTSRLVYFSHSLTYAFCWYISYVKSCCSYFYCSFQRTGIVYDKPR